MKRKENKGLLSRKISDSVSVIRKINRSREQVKKNQNVHSKKILAYVLSVCMTAVILLTGCDRAIEVSDSDATQTTEIIVYNWGDYIDEESISAFEDAFPQYTVTYRTFENNETMYPTLDNTYDVIIPSEYMIGRLIREDKLQKINKNLLPDADKYMDPLFRELQYTQDKSLSDQFLDYAVPYLYCTVGLVYDANQISISENSSDPEEIWGVLFDPQYKNKIGMYDSMRESIGAVLNYLGYSINTMDETELSEAQAALLQQKTDIAPTYGVDNLKDKLANGELAAAEAWSGDHLVILDRIDELGKSDDIDLQYALPSGSNWSVDMMAIPKNAQNIEGAHAFINYMYDPDIALANCEYVGYSTPNTEALALLPAEIRENISYYPDHATFKTLEPYYTDAAIEERYTAIWNTVKASS